MRPVNITHKEHDRPLMNAMFMQAQNMSSNKLVAYANADIVFFQDIMEVVSFLHFAKISEHAFLLTGRRWDLWQQLINFEDKHWSTKLQHKMFLEGTTRPQL